MTGSLIALPLLAGDRGPTWNDAARAAVEGMGLGTTSGGQRARGAIDRPLLMSLAGEGSRLRAGMEHQRDLEEALALLMS